MKKYTISTFLRPAITSDIFDDSSGTYEVLENKRVFFKNTDGTIYGPSKLKLPELENAYSRPRTEMNEFFKKQKEIEEKRKKQKFAWHQLIGLEKIFVASLIPAENALKIHLKVKQVEEFDIIEGNALIVNTAYYEKKENYIDGPYYITNTHKKEDFRNLIASKKMFVFDYTNLKPIKIIETITTAKAV